MNTTLLNQCSGNIFTSPQQLLQFIQRLEQDQQFIQHVSSSRETDCNLTYQLSHLAQSTSLNTVSTPQLGARHFSRLTRCYYCNNHGHFSRCCLERPKRTTRKSNPSLIYAHVFINNRKTRVQLDSGAEYSFIILAALSKIRHSQILPSKAVAHLADTSTPLPLLGEVRLHIRLNDTVTPITALVVKHLNSDFILGSDCFFCTGARIEYDRHQVPVRSYNGRSSAPFDKHIDSLALAVKLINSITVPPREVSIIQAKVDISSAKAAYFYPDADFYNVNLFRLFQQC
ncbi:unnamed protein product [Didymodactylos carnosus]|uniref:CCHC-type domain-containing protein n=1 Tax=Didymodactylos carnosus TaxID=1234261 RepID=A0A8S2FS95_9BILA|nr:unnamed protein product [Didymodactylos carnosus]CAF4339271.1 unnamed protein product [Didymodactylos carnosus]